jgi:hypothetical protein
MVRYRKTGSEALVTATSGGGVLGIPNYGVSVITSTAAGDWAMSAPVAGANKTLIVHPATSGTARVVKLSTTSSGDSISLLGSTGEATANELHFTSTSIAVIQLVGLTTAQWKVMFVTTGVMNGSTGVTQAAS